MTRLIIKGRDGSPSRPRGGQVRWIGRAALRACGALGDRALPLAFSLLLTAAVGATPHAKHRDTFYPNPESVIRANPMPFLWPQESGENTFLLGRSADLSDASEIQTEWSFAFPGKKLEPGAWYWQVSDHPVESFVVTEKVEWAMEIPAFETIAAKMPMSHPRLLLLDGEREAFAKRINPELRKEALEAANLFMSFSMAELQPPEVDFERLDDATVKRLAINDTKKFLGQVKTPILYLAKAWLLTGDERYGKKCVELTLGIRHLDQRIVGLNDFTRAAVLDTLVFAYDSCFGLFEAGDRKAIEKTIGAGAARIYEHLAGRLEAHLFDNHSWQKTYASLLRSAIALWGHEEQAEEWLEYTYYLWFARAPAGGFNFDGAWHNGTGYLTANFVTLIQVPLLWQRLAGVDCFAHPWYQNAADSIVALYPPGSYSAGFGDGHSSQTHPHWKRGVFIQLLARETQNPHAAWYVKTLKKWEHGKKKRIYDPNAKHKLDSEGLEWFVNLSDKPMPKSEPPTEIARVMPDSGFAAIHTKPAHVKDDVFIAFRSSGYGSGSHCLASQNGFNIIAGGKPLFLSSGYYTSFADPHTLLHYRHSRGHNTILADGIGQSIGTVGYGQIRRFHSTPTITYTLGDASDAYGGELTDDMWVKNFKKNKVEHSRENGFGNAGVNKFHRHLLFIHPINTLVILDELEAEKAIEWSWLLHAPNEMKSTADNRFRTSNGLFDGYVEVRGGKKSKISTEFFSPAINWQKHKAYDGSVRPLPNQRHLSVDSESAAKQRFLSIIQITPAGEKPQAVEWKKGGAKIGDWRISDDLDVFLGTEKQFSLGDPAIQSLEGFSSR